MAPASVFNYNAYFNEYEYLQAKTRQLNSIKFENPHGDRAWTMEDTAAAIADAGMTAREHYQTYGAFEKDAGGYYINPSNAFDANTYFRAKLYEIHRFNREVKGKVGEDVTLDDMIRNFIDGGLDPIAHYLDYGSDEADAAVMGTIGGVPIIKLPFVQTVPMAQRVDNDPDRDWNVPANYMPATRPPDMELSPWYKGPVFPMDVTDGPGRSNKYPSLAPDFPSSPLAVPGDTDYVAPPEVFEVFNYTQSLYIWHPSTSGTGEISDYWKVFHSIDVVTYSYFADNGSRVSAGAQNHQASADERYEEYMIANMGGVDRFFTRTGLEDAPLGRAEIQHLAITDAQLTDATTLVEGLADDDSLISLSSLQHLDTIYGFDHTMDKIMLPDAVTTLIKGTAVMSGATAEDFAAAVAAAQVGSGQAALFKHEGMYTENWYLFVNNDNAAFSDTKDIVIKLSGVTDAEAAAMTTDIFGVA